MSRLEEIKQRIAVLPDEMEIKETLIPMKVRDPKDPKKMIDDPHGRIQQRRMDIFDKADPLRKPVIHFHTMPEHPVFEARWREYAEAFIQMKSDIQFLIEQLEGKK